MTLIRSIIFAELVKTEKWTLKLPGRFEQEKPSKSCDRRTLTFVSFKPLFRGASLTFKRVF